MTERNTNGLPISPEQFRQYASKAVHGFVDKQFPKYFYQYEMEDMVSDVVLKIWRARESYDPAKGAYSTWVGTIARNVVRSEARAKSCRENISCKFDRDIVLDESEYGLYRSGEMSADGEFIAEEMHRAFYSRLVSERDRRFLAWQIEGLDAGEMAKREGITVNNVHIILCRMKRRLRSVA